MQFIKTRTVKSPVRNVEENAGIDFYIPSNTPEFLHDLHLKNPSYVHTAEADHLIVGEIVSVPSKLGVICDNGKIYIPPHGDLVIPSGIRSKFANNLALIANNKSGIATKKKLVFGASVIDASYQGEWHLHLINTSSAWQVVECDTKVIQFIPHLISTDEIEIVDTTAEDFYKDSTSSRGEGWAGSTGIK